MTKDYIFIAISSDKGTFFKYENVSTVRYEKEWGLYEIIFYQEHEKELGRTMIKKRNLPATEEILTRHGISVPTAWFWAQK